ncbi:MAG TPA: molybdenum cofactor guanylyltransferase [Bryobacteraceae bacterium]|nr:molybdenum cofactor guanylyltransferase [Bryobacteraceae bacterium]
MFGNRAGWVLTGGRSSRMGTDKALLEISGRPLALRVADEIAPLCGSVTLVGDPERYAHLGLRVIADAFPGQGPLAGMEAALAAAESDWNLIVACDMPALDTSILEELFRAAGDCALPRYDDGRVEPLCAVYHRRCHSTVLKALETGVRKVTEALRPLAIRYVPVAGEGPFANLNTPEEFRKYTNG